ncbi:hypothetical protein ABBQ32_008220 [Trebouxia sp. C0010 RCD-2024]
MEPLADIWHRCEHCELWQSMPKDDGGPTCRCGAALPDKPSNDQMEQDLWIQCDDCNKWRELSSSQFEQVQKNEKDARWACAMLFNGATCQLSDDWKMQKKVIERQAAAQQKQEAQQAKQEARDAMLAGRALRAQQRANGLSAMQRHMHSTSVTGDDGDSSGGEPFSKVSRRKRKVRAAPDEEECEDRDHWEGCPGCQEWVNLGRGRQPALSSVCHGCGTLVTWQGHQELQSWVQCDACGRWRTVPDSTLRNIEAEGEGGQWTCDQMQGGTTCRSSAGDWGAALRRKASQLRHHELRTCQPLQLSCCVIDVGDKQAERVQWTAHDVAPSSHFLEYIPGRDQLWTCEALKAGLDVYDAGSGEHVLWACALPESALLALQPFICRGMQLFQEGKLPVCTDGRLSAGPLDLPAFLAQASVSESVKQALHKQKVAHQAAAQAAVAGPAQQTDTQISQQAGDGKECVSTDVAEGLCSSATSSMSHGAAQPPASLPEAGMRPARQGSAAATSADTTSTAKAATPGSRRRTQQSADISTATQTACTTPEQQPQPQLQQQQQQAPEAQALQVASVVTNTLGLLPNSASDHVQIADATKAPLQPCCLQTPPAEGSVGMFSQPAKAHKGSVGLETLASDAHLAAEPAGRQEVMGTSLQQAEKKRSMAHMSAAARPQLWQVVHVSPDMRKAYIGDSSDRTVNGKSIMAFNKSWRSLPIQSWSGGLKIADMPGRQPNKLVASKLSALLSDQVTHMDDPLSDSQTMC